MTAKTTTTDVARLIREMAGNTIFSVCFRKRTTGKLRTMHCRLGVKSHLQGGDQGYDPVQHDLLTVYDVDKSGYRSIPLNALKWVKIRGVKYQCN